MLYRSKIPLCIMHWKEELIVFVDVLIPAPECQNNDFECIRTCTHQSKQNNLSHTVYLDPLIIRASQEMTFLPIDSALYSLECSHMLRLVCKLKIKEKKDVGVSKNNGTPKSSILIGFSIIFTIHFGGKIPLFLVQHPCEFIKAGFNHRT